MSYIGNQAYTVIETHVGSIEGTATAAVIQAKAKVDGQMWVASDTGDLWLSDGFVWMNVGRIKGDKGDTGQRGTSITGVVKTAAAGSVDTYTITYTDATTSTFEVSNANTWMTGAGIPSNANGNNGDLYLDTQTDIYYKKVTGAWEVQGTIKGDSFSFDARGTLAERAAHNTEAAGFGYLSYAETPPKVYYKLSATSGDWSAGTEIGKGEIGVSILSTSFTSTTDGSGLAGKQGATDTYTIAYDDGATDAFVVYNGLDVTNVNVINDSTTVVDRAWSSDKTSAELNTKANKNSPIAMAIALS